MGDSTFFDCVSGAVAGARDRFGRRADTAYGVLALLKEIHAKLPESKILLLAILPRGDKPEDAGRLRNQEVNAILQTYADGKTVHWLDIGPSFLNADGTLKRDLMPDALHPNLEGYRVWAEAMKPRSKNSWAASDEANPVDGMRWDHFPETVGEVTT